MNRRTKVLTWIGIIYNYKVMIYPFWLFPLKERRRIFGSLFGGSLLHFTMYLTQAYYVEYDYFLFPFYQESIHLNLYDSESSLFILPFLLP
jgi:hypothetical protein